MKNKKGFVLAAVLLVIVAAIIVPTWLSNQKKEPDVPAETTAVYTEETVAATQEPSTENQTAEHMAAYNDFLKNYNGGEYGEYFRFELVYFTDDDIPELFVSEENALVSSVKILTYINGKVVQIYEGGKYGTLNYIERNSIVVESDVHQGIVTGYVKRIGDDGSVEMLFSHSDNTGAVPEGSDDVYYKIGDEEVSGLVYEMEVFRRTPEDTSEFCDGIPMTTENIDKYCK